MNIADHVNSTAIKDNRLQSREAHADMTSATAPRHAPDEAYIAF